MCPQLVLQRLLGEVWNYCGHDATGYLHNKRATVNDICRISSAQDYIARCLCAPIFFAPLLGLAPAQGSLPFARFVA